MKQIRIVNYQTPKHSSVYIKQKQYSVWLGNHTTNYFTNEKDALRFLAETNRFLNDCLHELNYLYGIIFIEYRQIWFYTKGKENIEQSIKSCFNDADALFYKLTNKGQTINGNAFVFNWIIALTETIGNAIESIIDLYNEKRDFADLRRIKIFLRQIRSMKKDIESWGQLPLIG